MTLEDDSASGSRSAAGSAEARGLGINAEVFETYHRYLLWLARTLVDRGLCSLEIEGAERVTTDLTTPHIWVANHGGSLPLDVTFWGLAGTRAFGDDIISMCIVHDALFDAFSSIPGLRRMVPLCVPARDVRNVDSIRRWTHLGVFPEGASGNCKPWWACYQTRHFHTGFARLAAAREATVVPCTIIGGDEFLPVAWTMKWTRPVLGSVAPLPALVPPLTRRWKIVFHDPLSPPARDADRDELQRYAAGIRATIQQTLDTQTRGRPLVRISRGAIGLFRRLKPG